VPYAAIARGTLKQGTKATGTHFLLGGALSDAAYWLEVTTKPAAGEAQVKANRDVFQHRVVYQGPKRNAKWAEDEAKGRWRARRTRLDQEAQEAEHRPHRALHRLQRQRQHRKKFGDAMEQAYSTIKKMFPFDEAPEEKLLPVFLFTDPDQYYDYYMKVVGVSREEAERSKGHAWRDYYATYFEAVSDPVHIHEATHQIFANRLHLNGGGSWFQEGVAEFICTQKNDRNVSANEVKKSRHVPLAEFVKIDSLIASKDGKSGDSAAQHAVSPSRAAHRVPPRSQVVRAEVPGLRAHRRSCAPQRRARDRASRAGRLRNGLGVTRSEVGRVLQEALRESASCS
jgi:hypothetical protein